jgi:hypothetical protein
MLSDDFAMLDLPEELAQPVQQDSASPIHKDLRPQTGCSLAATTIDPLVWYIIQTILDCAGHPHACSSCLQHVLPANNQPPASGSGGLPVHQHTLCSHAIEVLSNGVTPGSELDALWPVRAVDELSTQLVQRVDALWAAEADVSVTLALADAGERLERLLGAFRIAGNSPLWPALRFGVPCRPTVVELLSTRFLGGELIDLV